MVIPQNKRCNVIKYCIYKIELTWIIKVEQEEANVNIENSFLKEKDINVCGLLSFIFSLIGFFVYSIPLGIASIVLGIIGIVKFNAEKQKFKWMGIVGVCIGAVDVVATIVDIIGTLIVLSAII